MSTLGAVKEPTGRVDILQYCLFALTTELRHHLANKALMTRRGLQGWSPLLVLTRNKMGKMAKTNVFGKHMILKPTASNSEKEKAC